MPDLDVIPRHVLSTPRRMDKFIADFVKTDTNHHGFDLAELENKLAHLVFFEHWTVASRSAEGLFLGNTQSFL